MAAMVRQGGRGSEGRVLVEKQTGEALTDFPSFDCRGLFRSPTVFTLYMKTATSGLLATYRDRPAEWGFVQRKGTFLRDFLGQGPPCLLSGLWAFYAFVKF